MNSTIRSAVDSLFRPRRIRTMVPSLSVASSTSPSRASVCKAPCVLLFDQPRALAMVLCSADQDTLEEADTSR
jgi:hypothetical protein